MNEPTDPTPDTLTSSTASAASLAAAPVLGDRLGTPQGATRFWPDYGRPSPSYVFLALLAIVTFACDIATKGWAETHLDRYPGVVEVWKDHVTL
ncbi:MAG: hypothetical protein ACREJ3_08980, partial [Polyangiaceae bacterium]